MKRKLERMKKIHALLKTLRSFAELSQEELGDRLHADQSFVSRMESGRSTIQLDVIASWVDACGGPDFIQYLIVQLQWLLSLVNVNSFNQPMRPA